jgi:hypothetical protein
MKTIARVGPMLVALALLAACAAMSTLQAEIRSYGEWPAARKPGTYAFDRLPSQQAAGEAQQRLEDAAHGALQAAGFTAADPGAAPDVLVQIGARITRYDRSPWDDPLWWRGGFGRFPGRPFLGPRWAPYPYPDSPRYDREVALMLRDRATGAPLYEARASSEGNTSGGDEVLGAMFRAAMADFPKSGNVPHNISVSLKP